MIRGEVVYLYAFDVAGEILTAGIKEILSRQPVMFEIRPDRALPKDIPLYKPLMIQPPELPQTLHGQPVQLRIRVYDVGVVTVLVRAPFAVDNLAELIPLHQAKLSDGTLLETAATKWCADVCSNLRAVLVRPVPQTTPEAYTVFCITQLPGVDDVGAWIIEQRRAAAGLLTETDPRRLSEAQVAEVVRLQRTFEKTDGVIIDWDAALVVDLSGYVDDLVYVLELANLQLEEFRAIDATLDQLLDRAYLDLEQRRPAILGVASPILRELRWHRVDITKLADAVMNITKFTGDWYLARVYLAARERFSLDAWRTSVERRLGQLDQIYRVIQAEINDQRMLWLEVIIVVFFAIDLLVLLLK